jgi:hypothetical protein
MFNKKQLVLAILLIVILIYIIVMFYKEHYKNNLQNTRYIQEQIIERLKNQNPDLLDLVNLSELTNYIEKQ